MTDLLNWENYLKVVADHMRGTLDVTASMIRQALGEVARLRERVRELENTIQWIRDGKG